MAGQGVRAVMTEGISQETVRKTQVLRIVSSRDDMFHRVRLGMPLYLLICEKCKNVFARKSKMFLFCFS